MAREWESQRKPTQGLGGLVEMIESFGAIGDRARQRNLNDLENILKLAQISKTPEQMASTQDSLNNVISKSSFYGVDDVAHKLVQTTLDNNRFEMDRFTNSIDQASDIINDPNFLDKADEWRNLESLRSSKTLDDGSYKYESISAMLSDEYSSIDTLLGNLALGKTSGFRYNKNIDFDDDEVVEKINTYKNRLDKAIQASLGDGVITPDEANLIMSGVTKAEFDTHISGRKQEIKNQITSQEAIVKLYTSEGLAGMMAMAQQGNISEEDAEGLQDVIALMPGSKQHELARVQAQSDLETLYTPYQYWTGANYKGESVLPGDEIEFGAAADDVDETVIEVDETTEMPEEDIKKLDEEKEKEVYTKEEEALIDSYDSDMAKLEEIDAWLKENTPVKDKFWEKDKASTRKNYQLEKKRIKKKWKSPGGGVIKDEEGNIIGDYRTGLERKVFELKKRLK